MNAALPTVPGICAMSVHSIDKVRKLEQESLRHEQVPIPTHHLIHAGLYARTIKIPAGVVLTGALIKRATVLIVSGDCVLTTGEGVRHLHGYNVLPASAHRKQAFVAIDDTDLTMLFPTSAQTVEAAEAEFTDEAEFLFSRRGENVVNITGES